MHLFAEIGVGVPSNSGVNRKMSRLQPHRNAPPSPVRPLRGTDSYSLIPIPYSLFPAFPQLFPRSRV